MTLRLPAHISQAVVCSSCIGGRSVAAVVLCLLLLASPALAQPAPISIPAGMSPEQAIKLQQQMGRRGSPMPTPGQPPGQPPQKPGQGGKPDASGKKPDGKDNKAEDAKPGGPVTRGNEPPSPPDPKELEVTALDGMLEFQFRNQPWPDVLKWYAQQASMSLDWQELPGDYINLATQRPYTVDETGDMLNRALLMRGYTMLSLGDVLIVTKVDSINPSLVPRVRPEELATLLPHTFVRTSFELEWLLAEEVNQEFAPMLSKNGKLTPLMTTNRLEAMDAAANLRDIYAILEREESTGSLDDLAKEFVLEYARASTVKQKIETFLGIASSSGGAGPSSSSTARMMQQMQQQMQKQMQAAQQAAARAAQAKGGAAGAAPRRPRPDNVYIVANDRTNSVIVHAQPNKMAIIASFIQRIDVPNGNGTDLKSLESRFRVFRLASLDPTEFVGSLEAMDVLEPQTQLRVDAENNSIIANASWADQLIIQRLIERLDGSERSFEVIQLKRLDAESVAGSIRFLMGTDEEDDKNSRSRSYGYFDYGYYSSRNQPKKKSDKMRVGANIQDNQILLWVNSIELEEVQKLLVKLGEIPEGQGNNSRVRVIDATRQPETYEYLRRLKEEWERSGRGTINIPSRDLFEPDETEEEPSDSEAAEEGSSGDTEAEQENPESSGEIASSDS
ncbi:MAG TPA: hypothetical protein DDW52_22035 [Planctomycetaceae bacterium]|nr:hypothetical protein [Planctomycetaceae bacterium]